MMINRLYTLFLGLLLALFVGVAIAAFYPGPTPPEGPVPMLTDGTERVDPAAQRSYDDQSKAFTQAQKVYDRNVSLLALGAAIILVVLGLGVFAKVVILGDSLLLGGIFTLAYSTIRGFGTDNLSRFLIVSAGLAVAIAVSYVKFIRPHQAPAKR